MGKKTSVDPPKSASTYAISAASNANAASTQSAKPIRESSTTKLKWNMLLQQPSASSSLCQNSLVSPRPIGITPSVASIRTPSPLISSPKTNTDSSPTSPAASDGKKASVDSTASNASLIAESTDSTVSANSAALSTSTTSMIDSAGSNIGFDWKVIGQPNSDLSQAGVTQPGHSRERAVSLLERVSSSHLTDIPSATEQVPQSAKISSRGPSLFSPFGSGFDIRVGEGQFEQSDSGTLSSRSSLNAGDAFSGSRSTSPSYGPHNPQGHHSQTYSFYAPQPSAAPVPENNRRQSLLEGTADWTNTSGEYTHHRSSISYGGYPNTMRSMAPSSRFHHSPSPTLHPYSAHTPFPPRRGSIPHRPGEGESYDYMAGLEAEMSAMAFQEYYFHDPSYYQPYPSYHPQVPAFRYPTPPVPLHGHHQVSHIYGKHYEDHLHSQMDVANGSSSTAELEKFRLSAYRGPLYVVEFKAGRTEVFYVLEGGDGRPVLKVSSGDLVIVEADRGEDLGKVTTTITIDRLKQLMFLSDGSDESDVPSDKVEPEFAPLLYAKEIVPKRVYRLASPGDLKLLHEKARHEAFAMVRCQSRIRQKRLPMEVVDAEYQWDRNKLTFYFQAEKRIDFRELVRDLYRIYKTRIWMCAVDKNRLAALAEMHKNGESLAAEALAAALAAEEEEGTVDEKEVEWIE